MLLYPKNLKKPTLKQNLCCGALCAALYFVVQYLSDVPLYHITQSYVQPATALNPICGILFGVPGFVGCAIGSILEQFYAHGFAWVPVLIFPIDILYGLIPCVLWNVLSGKETNLFRMDSHRRVIRYTLVILVTSCFESFMLSWFELYYVGPENMGKAFITSTLDFFDMGMLIGLPLMIFVSLIGNYAHNPERKFRKLFPMEKIVLLFSAVEFVMLVFLFVRVFVEKPEEMSVEEACYITYQALALVENIILGCMIFVVVSAIDKDAIFRATEKIAFVAAIGCFIFDFYLAAATDLVNYSMVGAVNVTVYGVCAIFTSVMIITFILDKHSIARESVLFFILMVCSILSLWANGMSSYYESIGSEGDLLDMFTIVISIIDSFSILVGSEYIKEALNIGKNKYKYTFIFTTSLAILSLCLDISSVWGGESELNSFYGWIVIILIFDRIILKERADNFMKVALITLISGGTVIELITFNVEYLSLGSVGFCSGILMCFVGIYIKRSNSLSDTQKDLDFASGVQLSMLPVDFEIDGVDNVEIYASMDPAKEVGGDFYDFYKLSDKHIAFVVADVSGKGLPGAMMMMRSITAIKNFAKAGLPVDRLMEMASNNINEHNDAMLFVTAWMGLLNVETGKLRFVNAGHNPPIIRHANGSTEEIKSKPDLIMGFFPDVKYRKNVMFLKPGDTLFLYTDGITEAYSDFGEQYGMDRLHTALQKSYSSSKELCENVVGDVNRFVGVADQFDDMTVLAVGFKGLRKKAEEKAQELNIDFGEALLDDELALEGCEEIVLDDAAPAQNSKNIGSIMFEESEFAAPIEIELAGDEITTENFEEYSAETSKAYENLGFEEVSAEPVVLEISSESEAVSLEEIGNTNIIFNEEKGEESAIEIIPVSVDDDAVPDKTEIFKKSYDPLNLHVIGADNLDHREINIIATRDNVYAITDEIDSFLMAIDCTMDAQMKIDIAFDEIYSNIVNYAFPVSLGSCQIVMDRLKEPKGVKISFIDSGVEYNPLEHIDPDAARSLEERSHGGVGIYIVKNTMDSVEYERKDEKNIFTLVKYF